MSVRSQKIIVVKIIRGWSFSLGKQHLSCSFWQINLLSDYTSLNTRRHLEIFRCLGRKRSTLTFDVIENLAHKSRQTAEAKFISYKLRGEPTLLIKSTIFTFGPAQSCNSKKLIYIFKT